MCVESIELLSRLQGECPRAGRLGSSCQRSSVKAVEVLEHGWLAPDWSHSMEFTAFSCGSLQKGKEGKGSLFAYFKPNGHSPEASQGVGDITLSWAHSPPSPPATCSLKIGRAHV